MPPAAAAPARPPLVPAESSVSRSSVVLAASLVLTGLLGAGQALLLVFIVGEGPRTDAFLAAYSLYLALTIFGASLRASIVPLLGPIGDEDAFRVRASAVAGRVAGLGLLLGLLLLVTAPLLAPLLTHGLPEDERSTTVAALAILAPVAVLQVVAATLSAVLSAVRRFTVSAVLYVAGAALSLVTATVLLLTVGVLGSAAGLLAGSALLAGGHAVYAARLGLKLELRPRWLWDREQLVLGAKLLAGAGLGIALQLQSTVALSGVSGEEGAITVYSYAFFLVVLLQSMSSLPLTIVLLPDLVSAVERGGAEGARSLYVRGVPYTMAVLIPLLVALAAFGEPVLRTVFAGGLSDDSVHLLYELTVILGLGAIPMALVYLCSSVVLALGRLRAVAAASVAGVVLQLIAVPLVRDEGATAVAGAHAVVILVLAVILLGVCFGGAAARVLGAAALASAPAVGLALVIALVRVPLGDDPGVIVAVLAAAVGLAAYGALVLRFWPAVGAAFAGLAGRGGGA